MMSLEVVIGQTSSKSDFQKRYENKKKIMSWETEFSDNYIKLRKKRF